MNNQIPCEKCITYIMCQNIYDNRNIHTHNSILDFYYHAGSIISVMNRLADKCSLLEKWINNNEGSKVYTEKQMVISKYINYYKNNFFNDFNYVFNTFSTDFIEFINCFDDFDAMFRALDREELKLYYKIKSDLNIS